MVLLNQAVESHQNGDLKQAYQLYLSHLQQAPEDAEALRLIGMLCWQQGQQAQATGFLERAYALGNPSARLLGNLGLIKQQNHQLDDAISFYRQALAMAPSASSWSNLGIALRYQKDHAGAESALRRAHALSPNDPSVLLNLSTTLRQMDKAEQACELLTQYCHRNQPTASVCSEYARSALATRQLDLAELWIQKALSLNTQDPSIWINLALIRKASREWDSALDALDQAIQLSPLLPEVYVQFAQIFQAQQFYEPALEACEEGIRYFPENLSLQKTHVLVLSDLERFEDAEHRIGQLLEVHDDAELWLQKGFVLIERYELLEAAQAFEHCLRLEPTHVQAQHFLNVALKRIPEQSSTDYAQAVFDDYAERFDHHLLNTLQYQVPKHFQEALEQYAKPVRLGLDLGCGTGLLGSIVKPYTAQLTGIDLSAKMLDRARQRKLYDQLVQGDIVSYLSSTSGFDLMVAGDVFNYLGRLDSVLGAVFHALNPAGLCIFTIEATAEQSDDVLLSVSGRFQHSMAHVKNILKAHPFLILAEKWVKLRQEGGQWVNGILIVLQRPQGDL